MKNLDTLKLKEVIICLPNFESLSKFLLKKLHDLQHHSYFIAIDIQVKTVRNALNEHPVPLK